MNFRPSPAFAVGLTLILSGVVIAAVAEDLFPRDSDYDYDPPAPGSYTLPVVKLAEGLPVGLITGCLRRTER